jgi:hypothetical protein
MTTTATRKTRKTPAAPSDVYRCQHGRVIAICPQGVPGPDMTGLRCCPWASTDLCVLILTQEHARWSR